MTAAEGRGLFATRLIKEGELIIVEKAVADVHQYDECEGTAQEELLERCLELVRLEGTAALRLTIASE